MEGRRWDMLEWLGPDACISVFNYLDNSADLARAGAVSKSWRKFVISNQFGKRLCMTLCPEISNFTHIQLWKRYSLQDASPSTSMDWQIMERARITYTYFAHCFLSYDSDKDCIMACIGASGTDRFPMESIQNTLKPTDIVHGVPSYWSSVGQADPNVQESLIYRLEWGLCLVNEIRIRPFKGGVLKIELLGRVQKQEHDGLYYICVGYVQVIGCLLSPLLDVASSTDSIVLKCYQPFSDSNRRLCPYTL